MKKKNLFTLFTTLVLCLCTMAIGVYAAKTATVTTGGSITFTATSVNCTVSATATGGSTNPTFNTITLNNATTTGSWTGKNVVFAEAGGNVTIAIKVTNLSSDRSITVAFESTATSLVNITQTTPTGTEIAGSGSATYNVVLQLTSKDVKASGNWGVSITLTGE